MGLELVFGAGSAQSPCTSWRRTGSLNPLRVFSPRSSVCFGYEPLHTQRFSVLLAAHGAAAQRTLDGIGVQRDPWVREEARVLSTG